MLPIETIRLTDGKGEAWIAPARGGMVTRFSIGGEDVLYLDEATLGDPSKNVRGGIPILFPIAGKLMPDRLPGATAPLAQHGFARNRPWRVVSSAGRAVLALDSDDATRAAYPFDFALTFSYALRDGALEIEQRFENRGAAPMAIQPGLHPYFAVPDKAGARVATDATVAPEPVRTRQPRRPIPWAELLKRTFHTDVLTCPRCGGTRRVAAVVLRSATAQAILEHLRLPSRPLPLAPATSPPSSGSGECSPSVETPARLTTGTGVLYP